jgi:hypothetical protein
MALVEADLSKLDLVPVGEKVAETLKPEIKDATNKIAGAIILGFIVVGLAIKQKK